MSMTFQFDNFAHLIFMDGHGIIVFSFKPDFKKKKITKKVKNKVYGFR